MAAWQYGRRGAGRLLANEVGAFNSQRRNARKRKIGWHLTLLEWWTIWQQSGKWEERGRGSGYVMCRYGDLGPYALGNVFIGGARENTSEGTRKNKDLPMGVSFRTRGNWQAYEASISIAGKKCRLGSFKTPTEAHAAYLMARNAASVSTIAAE